jgi:hypothetical protein
MAPLRDRALTRTANRHRSPHDEKRALAVANPHRLPALALTLHGRTAHIMALERVPERRLRAPLLCTRVLCCINAS